MVQALANTYSFEDDEELLADPDAARRWLIGSDLARKEVAVGEAEFLRLLETRRVFRGLLDANLSGAPAEAELLALGRLAGEYPVPLASDGSGRLWLDLDPAASVDDFIAQLVGICFQAQLRGEWSRLKVCASDDCRWAFYDSSRDRGGTWCQMEVCGNRIKNRRYRRRSARGEDRADPS